MGRYQPRARVLPRPGVKVNVAAAMITYLKDGWHTRPGHRLRAQVVDGAIDTASMLFRASVPPHTVTRLALKIRGLTTFVNPVRQPVASSSLTPREKKVLQARLQAATDRHPALQGFISDCLNHVDSITDLRALYLHVVQVSQMMQLLMVAKLSGASQGILAARPAKSPKKSPATSPRRTKKVTKQRRAK